MVYLRHRGGEGRSEVRGPPRFARHRWGPHLMAISDARNGCAQSTERHGSLGRTGQRRGNHGAVRKRVTNIQGGSATTSSSARVDRPAIPVAARQTWELRSLGTGDSLVNTLGILSRKALDSPGDICSSGVLGAGGDSGKESSDSLGGRRFTS